jgi:hypothetical protein
MVGARRAGAYERRAIVGPDAPACPGDGPSTGVGLDFEPLPWAIEGPLTPAMGHRRGWWRLARPGDGPLWGLGSRNLPLHRANVGALTSTPCQRGAGPSPRRAELTAALGRYPFRDQLRRRHRPVQAERPQSGSDIGKGPTGRDRSPAGYFGAF